MRLQDNLFFTVVGAGGDPDFAVRRPLAAEGNCARGQLWRHGNIKFEAAGDRQLVALQAQSQKAIAVFFILRRNQRDATEQPTHKFPSFA